MKTTFIATPEWSEEIEDFIYTLQTEDGQLAYPYGLELPEVIEMKEVYSHCNIELTILNHVD